MRYKIKVGDDVPFPGWGLNLSPAREVLSRIFIPLGFMIFLISGAVMMIKRGEQGLAAVVIASAVFCAFWLKRDAGRAIQMIVKKSKANK
jgi:protein-S-isoprenylcysteine O-methyltransferase Ste14